MLSFVIDEEERKEYHDITICMHYFLLNQDVEAAQIVLLDMKPHE